ncbi:MAG: arginine--tRNA ligase, partial [Dehalococcoidales bacterium]|nr:arginine--tRNA ligase [Dehalococcoidales bacterium]
MELKNWLEELLAQAASQAQQAGKLPPAVLPEPFIERSQKPEHGDYASGFPLKLARVAGAKPMSIAEDLIGLMPPAPEIKSIVAAPPGFINFTLKSDWLTNQVDSILSARDSYANIDIGQGSRVQVEFVSLNPTGPLHVGNVRGAILGSTLANVLSAAGYDAEREYYFNDAGNQINLFYRSLFIRYLQALDKEAEMPEAGYMGNYLVDLAGEFASTEGDRFLKMDEAGAVTELGKLGVERVISKIKEELQLLGIEFDSWFTEQSLYGNGQYERAMSLLRKEGYIAEKEGATWFVSTALGEDKDNVLVRSDGSPTYFATDIAYHYNKFLERKFDRVIDIWGADHQGHVPRLKAAVGALG